MNIASDVSKILKIFKKACQEYMLGCNITICNDFRALMLNRESSDLKDNMYMWVLIDRIDDEYLYNIDIANIVLPRNYRRQGFLTFIYNELNKCKLVNKVRFINVCTYEMKEWCNKNGLTKCTSNNDYIKIDKE